MTAINFVNDGRRALVMLDAASIDRKGKILSIEPKGQPTTAFPGFIVTAGPRTWIDMFDDRVISRFDSIDDLAEHGEAAFRECQAWIAGHPGAEEVDYSVHVFAWSPAQQRVRVVDFWSSIDSGFKVDVAWWATPLPKDTDVSVSFVRAGRDGSFRPDVHGLRLIEAQRRERMTGDFAAGAHFVGGFVDVVEITSHGVDRSRLHTWPEDRIGEPIRPLPQIGRAASAAPMNRAERRRLARAA